MCLIGRLREGGDEGNDQHGGSLGWISLYITEKSVSYPLPVGARSSVVV